MSRIRPFFVALVLAAAPASAAISDNPPAAQAPTAAPPPPASIWQVDAEKAALHLQSNLRCDYEVNGFQRTRLTVYDHFGFDVSCNYVDRVHSVITIYLTRRTASTLADDFDKAKRELVQFTPEAVPLSEAEQKEIAVPLGWQRLIYSERSGAIHSGIWMADLDGWTLEFRATYAPDQEAIVLDQMARLTQAAQASAGGHLDRCTKSQIPVRNGKQITDKDKLMANALMFGAMAGPDAIHHVDTQGAQTGTQTLPTPSEWCAEKAVLSDGVPMMLWHAVSPEGQTGTSDRISVMTTGPAPAFEVDLDAIGSLLGGAATNGKPEYTVSFSRGDEVFLFAVYDDRPDEQSLAKLMADWFHDKLKPLAKVNPKTNNISLFMDP